MQQWLVVASTGFFMDVYLMHGCQEKSSITLLSDRLQNDLHVNQEQTVMLADESANLMLKLKFLPYKVTF